MRSNGPLPPSPVQDKHSLQDHMDKWLLCCHFILVVCTQTKEGGNVSLEDLYDIVNNEQMFMKACSWLYDQPDLENVEEVV